MATLHNLQPAQFLGMDRKPLCTSAMYLKQWQTYFLAIGADKYTEERKAAIILLAVGTTCAAMLRPALPEKPTVAEIFELLSKYFPAATNPTMARLDWQNRLQRPGETVLEFYAEVVRIAEGCHFGDMEDEMLRDKLILGTTVKYVKSC